MCIEVEGGSSGPEDRPPLKSGAGRLPRVGGSGSAPVRFGAHLRCATPAPRRERDLAGASLSNKSCFLV